MGWSNFWDEVQGYRILPRLVFGEISSALNERADTIQKLKNIWLSNSYPVSSPVPIKGEVLALQTGWIYSFENSFNEICPHFIRNPDNILASGEVEFYTLDTLLADIGDNEWIKAPITNHFFQKWAYQRYRALKKLTCIGLEDVEYHCSSSRTASFITVFNGEGHNGSIAYSGYTESHPTCPNISYDQFPTACVEAMYDDVIDDDVDNVPGPDGASSLVIDTSQTLGQIAWYEYMYDQTTYTKSSTYYVAVIKFGKPDNPTSYNCVVKHYNKILSQTTPTGFYATEISSLPDPIGTVYELYNQSLNAGATAPEEVYYGDVSYVNGSWSHIENRDGVERKKYIGTGYVALDEDVVTKQLYDFKTSGGFEYV